MKKLSLIIIAACMNCFSFAQTQVVPPGFVCSYYGEPVSYPVTVINSSEDAQNAIAAIMDVVGLEANFEVKQAAIPNAAAIIYNNKRYILFNPNFISRINSASGDKWAAMAILAHEIGHHLDGHTLEGNGSHPETELQADEFSGFVLRKMGATKEQAQSAIRILPNSGSTATHPAKDSRLISIDNGWTKADAQLTGKQFTAKAITAPAAAQTSANITGAIDPASVNFNVYFDSDRKNKFFITKDNKLITIKENELLILGIMTKTQDDDYPLMIRIEPDDYFLISRTGNIMTKEGKKIGYLRG
jgi:hypothetical protein